MSPQVACTRAAPHPAEARPLVERISTTEGRTGYLAAEQARGDGNTAATDVWGLFTPAETATGDLRAVLTGCLHLDPERAPTPARRR